ncbi:MAG: chromate transporter [Peptostreptococcaceae bacterium]
MIYVTLFLEFFKVGLFTIGGGLACLPFLYEIAEKYPWFDKSMIADMVAISQSTPGPIGINMATYAGYQAGGLLGGLVATIGTVAPSFIIIIIIAHYLNKFKTSETVQLVFKGLRPAVAALIAVACFEIMKISIFAFDKFALTHNIFDIIELKSLALFGVVFYVTNKFDKHPIIYIIGGAIIGILLKM